jgi:ABC-type Mn2+/Zn2+ transport system ATPase subunit
MYRFQVKDPNFLPHIGCDVDFSVNKGELLALVGENGVGKTTLVQRFSRHSINVSLVEQKASDYFFDRKLKRVKDIFLISLTTDNSRKFFESNWKAFHLDKKENRFLSALSGGEGQALKLCFGLSIPKDLYILDEPSQFLDKNSKEHLKGIITLLLQEGKGVLVVEHDLSWLPTPVRVVKLDCGNGVLVLGDSWSI